MMEMVGRDDDVFKLSALLNAARFVTWLRSRDPPGRGRARLQTGCACLSAGRHGDHGGGCPDICRAKAVRRTRGGERRAPRPQRCGNRNRGLHLRRGREEMHLQAAQGVSLMFTRGNSEAARVALNQSLAIAQQRRDAPNQLQLLSLLHMFHHRIGDFKTSAALSLPRPLRLHPPSRWPIPLWGVHSTISAISAAPAWSLRQRYSVGRTISGPARSISTSNTTITPTSP
jgi:hypothetical protein